MAWLSESVSLTIDQFKLTKMSQWNLTDYIPNIDDHAKERPRLYDIIGINSSSVDIPGPIGVNSTSADDITQKITIYGIKDDKQIMQEVILNGLGRVDLNALDTLHFINLDNICKGTIQIGVPSGPGGIGDIYASILPGNLSNSLISYKNVLRLAPIPDKVYTIKLKYYKNIPQLENNGDYLDDLKPIFNTDIIERAYIQYLYYNGQENLASNLESTWVNQIKEKIDMERRLDRQDSQKQFGRKVYQAYPYDDVFDRY